MQRVFYLRNKKRVGPVWVPGPDELKLFFFTINKITFFQLCNIRKLDTQKLFNKMRPFEGDRNANVALIEN